MHDLNEYLLFVQPSLGSSFQLSEFKSEPDRKLGHFSSQTIYIYNMLILNFLIVNELLQISDHWFDVFEITDDFFMFPTFMQIKTKTIL